MAISKVQIRILDRMAAQKCKEHAGYRCVWCGVHQPEHGLHWAHIVTRAFKSLRWNLKNCLCMCSECHRWAHERPLDFHDRLIQLFGYDWWQEIRQTPPEKPDYDEIVKYLYESTPDDCLIPDIMKID